jgi:hypothetical protein
LFPFFCHFPSSAFLRVPSFHHLPSFLPSSSFIFRRAGGERGEKVLGRKGKGGRRDANLEVATTRLQVYSHSYSHSYSQSHSQSYSQSYSRCTFSHTLSVLSLMLSVYSHSCS